MSDYNVIHEWLHVSGGQGGRHPHVIRCEVRRYMDGSEKVVKGKVLYIQESKQVEHLTATFNIAQEALSHLRSHAPMIKP